MKIGFVSLGCPKNLVDSEVMMGQLVARGHELTPHPDQADVLVVNTCSFIDPAKQESIDTILEMAEYKKIGRARSSVTETMSLRIIPDDVRKACVENGIVSKSLLLQVARQPSEKKMHEMVDKIVQGGMTRDEARRARQEETAIAPRPQPYVFNYKSDDESFAARVQFRKSNVSREELASAIREILREIESGAFNSSAA